jgi:putative transposase
MPYWNLNFHPVWTTKDRATTLIDGRAILVERSIRASSRDQGAVVHEIGIMPDHIHLAVSIPPAISIAAFMKQVKGSSSYLLNHDPTLTGQPQFVWQAEYGALSFGDRSLNQVLEYVRGQAVHYATGSLWPDFERIERER